MATVHKITPATAENFPPTPPSEPNTAAAHDGIATLRAANGQTSQTQHIWIVTGPAGSGKTSVAEFLAAQLALPYIEGDSFHPPENVKKMSAGQSLTDADRWDWLIILREQALETLAKTGSPGVFVTCSALKRKYRDVMRVASYHRPDVRVHFIFLQASEALLLDRVKARVGHWMKDNMVRSQIQSLEAPQPDEADVLAVDASGTSAVVEQLALGVVRNAMVDGEAVVA